MFKKINITIVFLFLIMLINGCSWNKKMDKKEFTHRETILTKAKNYGGLITLYRNELKIEENEDIRLKLSTAYYQSGDTKSSLYYLQPIVHKKSESVYLLQAKNFIDRNDNISARTVTNNLLEIAPKSAEAHNINGIVLASSGEISKAENAIENSRSLFISDEIAMNNLAVIAMLDNRYTDAVRILLPDYLAGKRGRLMLHNLVFSLVKVNDKRYAKKIIIAEKMAIEPDELILALSQVNRPYENKTSMDIE
ncbi:tetratricopeptide repeat protein [Yersinia vastinensis]|uniref:tetratricopeptide repeat protein n=1 Tax=Yersinia vastinensis TaxID=2890318 RepID=UPI0011A4B7E3|nr:tetratricopeptide repeat protein [Yersinia vastinensis]